MHDTADMQARHGRILAELAEIGMTIAREMQAQVLAAETPEAKAQAAAAYPRVARAVRQSLALEAKLQRDARREAVDVRKEAEREFAVRLRRRKTLVAFHVERAIANATPDDNDTIDLRTEDLRDRLDDDLLDASFLDRPVADIIADLHLQLGLEPPDIPIPPPSGEVSAEPTEGVRSEADPPDTPPPEPAPEPDVRDSFG